MSNKILTIVVPTYNAENYLRDNLESFCHNTILDDIEILIINDGSTDNSLAIAEEYVNAYPGSYRVITKENGGHGSGINYGIQHAKGTYFKVVDADDWVESQPFIELVQYLKETNSDIIYSGFQWVFDKGQPHKEDFEKKAEMKIPFKGVNYRKEYRFDEIATKIYVKMHNLTIKTEILTAHSILIDEHCYYVDAEFIAYPIPYVNTIAFLPNFVYMYRIGSVGQSIGMNKMQKNEQNYDRVIASLLAFYQHLGTVIPCSEAKKVYLANLIARIVAGKIKIMLSFPASQEKKQQLTVFDRRLKASFPDIYNRNINKAVTLLRKTNYLTYTAASILVRNSY